MAKHLQPQLHPFGNLENLPVVFSKGSRHLDLVVEKSLYLFGFVNLSIARFVDSQSWEVKSPKCCKDEFGS